MPSNYAMHCFGCGDEVATEMRANVDTTIRELERKADAAGWGMALIEVGDVYICAACRPGFPSFYPFPEPLSRRQTSA